MEQMSARNWYPPLVEAVGELAEQLHIHVSDVVQVILTDYMARDAANREIHAGQLPDVCNAFLIHEDGSLALNDELFSALLERYVKDILKDGAEDASEG